MSYRYKLKEDKKLKELLKDLAHFNQLLREVFTNKKVVEEKEFLTKAAELIQKLDRHAYECSTLQLWSEGAHLIDFLFKTPLGAPFVSESTFLLASYHYVDELPEKSTLKALLSQLAYYNKRMHVPFIKNLKTLESELSNYVSDYFLTRAA